MEDLIGPPIFDFFSHTKIVANANSKQLALPIDQDK